MSRNQGYPRFAKDRCQLPQGGASCHRTAAWWDSRNRIWCPPAPNSISDCFGVPVAKGQRRGGIQEIEFGALRHQIRFRIVLACQLPKVPGARDQFINLLRNQGYPCRGPASQLDRNGRTLKKNKKPRVPLSNTGGFFSSTCTVVSDVLS